MNAFLLGIAVVIVVLIIAGLYRVGRGPTVFDRFVAVALASVNSVLLIVVVGFLFDRVELFVDIALAYALLAFLFPIALGKYFESRSPGRRMAEAEPDQTGQA